MNCSLNLDYVESFARDHLWREEIKTRAMHVKEEIVTRAITFRASQERQNQFQRQKKGNSTTIPAEATIENQNIEQNLRRQSFSRHTTVKSQELEEAVQQWNDRLTMKDHTRDEQKTPCASFFISA
jgi:hypothetical protein